MEENNNPEWLVRDSSNNIRGPFRHSDILQQIKKGQIKNKTEMAKANSYWFAMEEKAELANFFPELGLKTPEQATQFTATLTQADLGDRGMEVTQFTPTPTRKELSDQEGSEPTPPSGTTVSSGKMEWLSDEMAAEFGDEMNSEPLAMQTEPGINPLPQQPAPEPKPARSLTTDEAAREEFMKRATVKADTLPSEHKGFTGERPKPINTVLKNSEKGAQAPAQQANLVSVPVESPDAQARNITHEDEAAAFESAGRRKLFLISGSALFVLVLISLAYSFWPDGSAPVRKAERQVRALGTPEAEVRRSLILYDLEGTKEAMAEFELEPSAKGNVTVPLAQALLKKEFLFDADGAIMSLQTARSLAGSKRLEAEVDNLMASYQFDKDRQGSVEVFKRIAAAYPSELVFRYNLALSYLRNGDPDAAIQTAAGLASQSKGSPFSEDVNVLLGWAKDIASRGGDAGTETAYLKALEANSDSSKARLGLAIFRFRKNGIKAAENDFRAFLETLPELDPPTEALNFRKMTDFDFYNYARNQIRDLNIPMGAAGNKPSPLVMAVDAVLSCLQSRTAEAEKILDGALSAAPGDIHLMKAVGYHRWKEGRYAELVDLLRDFPKEKAGFSVNLLMGKAYLKIGRKELAESHFQRLTTVNPSRSEGWSLLGDLQLQMGKEDLARKNLQNAISKNPMDLLALRGLDQLGVNDVITPELAANLPF